MEESRPSKRSKRGKRNKRKRKKEESWLWTKTCTCLFLCLSLLLLLFSGSFKSSSNDSLFYSCKTPAKKALRKDPRRQGGIGPFPYFFTGKIVPKGKIPYHTAKKKLNGLSHKISLESHGSEYGGWMCDASAFTSDTIIYDVGLGEDTSWDEGIIKKYDLQVWGYDPTPKSKAHVDARFPTRSGILRLPTRAKFHYVPEGLSTSKGVKTFTKPKNPNHVSMRAGNVKGLGATIDVNVNTLENWMKSNGHTRIDVLKLDIEGSEYDVLEDFIQRDYFPFDQLLVEWHFRWDSIPTARHKNVLKGLKSKRWVEVHSKNNGQETVFLRKPVSPTNKEEDLAHIEINIPPSQPLMTVAKDMAKRLPQNVVVIQVLNAGYVEMTLSWICNMQQFPGVIDRTLFIATDQTAYESLLRFDDSLHVVLYPHATPINMHYGEFEYYNLMLFRTKMITKLLKNGISLFLTESDAVWLKDPIDYVLDYKGDQPNSLPDMVTMSDKKDHHILQGGFQLLRSTKPTIKIWTTLSQKFQSIMKRFRPGQHLDEKGNEQLMLTGLTSKAKKKGSLNIQYTPFKHFLPGHWWYDNKKLAQKYKTPYIILNNWISGNKNKKARAKKFGHWFLFESDDRYYCLIPRNE
jgi:FkbM family methyltransferase